LKIIRKSNVISHINKWGDNARSINY